MNFIEIKTEAIREGLQFCDSTKGTWLLNLGSYVPMDFLGSAE